MHSHLASGQAFARFLSAWETGTLPKSEWTHAAHVAVCASYAVLYPTELLDRIREGILRYNTAVGTANTETSGYHETLTRLWCTLVAREVAACPSPLEAARRAVTRYGEARDLHRRYYSFDVVRSTEARRAWIEPDLDPASGP